MISSIPDDAPCPSGLQPAPSLTVYSRSHRAHRCLQQRSATGELERGWSVRCAILAVRAAHASSRPASARPHLARPCDRSIPTSPVVVRQCPQQVRLLTAMALQQVAASRCVCGRLLPSPRAARGLCSPPPRSHAFPSLYILTRSRSISVSQVPHAADAPRADDDRSAASSSQQVCVGSFFAFSARCARAVLAPASIPRVPKLVYPNEVAIDFGLTGATCC